MGIKQRLVSDASDSRDKAKHIDFGSAIAAALMKKEVPVLVVTDQTKAQWIIRSASSQREDSTGTKIAKLAFGGGPETLALRSDWTACRLGGPRRAPSH